MPKSATKKKYNYDHPPRPKAPLNSRELRLLTVLHEWREPMPLEDLARLTFRGKGVTPDTKGNSWVRNSLRRLHGCGLVAQVGRGLYQAATWLRRVPSTLSDLQAAYDRAHPRGRRGGDHGQHTTA